MTAKPPTDPYPRFTYYPRWQTPPAWVAKVLAAFDAQQAEIDTERLSKALVSDAVLHLVGSGLEDAGFQVEASKQREHKLYRPVFYGENGRPSFQYEIDAYHAGERIALEVEAGRATLGNAIYRDIVQQSLMADVEYGVVAVPIRYRYQTNGRATSTASYTECRELLDAVYGGPRLALPFKGFLLIGY